MLAAGCRSQINMQRQEWQPINRPLCKKVNTCIYCKLFKKKKAKPLLERKLGRHAQKLKTARTLRTLALELQSSHLSLLYFSHKGHLTYFLGLKVATWCKLWNVELSSLKVFPGSGGLLYQLKKTPSVGDRVCNYQSFRVNFFQIHRADSVSFCGWILCIS